MCSVAAKRHICYVLLVNSPNKLNLLSWLLIYSSNKLHQTFIFIIIIFETLLSVTCECSENVCRSSTLTNSLYKHLMRSKAPNTLEVPYHQDNLDRSKHMMMITTTKANARLSFIKRNLKDCPQKLKDKTYISFVDYCA